MGRAQYAKGRVQLKVGRNNACRRNAVTLDPSVRVATLPYTKAETPRASDKSDDSAPLTPRSSARLRAKILDNLVGGNLPRGNTCIQPSSLGARSRSRKLENTKP